MVAFGLRASTVVVPIAASWMVTHFTAAGYWRPPGAVGSAVWLAQIAVVGTAVVVLVGRVSRRLLPLAALYSLSIAFPDKAPSRFKVALRSGNVKNVKAEFDDVRANGFGADQTEAAARILELVEALSRHERLTRGHTDRVRAYTDLIAEELGVNRQERDKLRWASMLHDIGKLAVPAELLNKPGRPTEKEWDVLSSHPAVGGELVEPLAAWLGDWRLVTSQHHERWDGTGYPNKLAGTQISLGGRIVAVADAYDVITSSRSYKKPMSTEAARKELVRCAGNQFDPTVVRAFLNASLGHPTSRVGIIGWLVEFPRILATAGTQAANAAGSVVAASAIATVAAVTVASPPPPAEIAQTAAVIPEPPTNTTSTTTPIPFDDGLARRAATPAQPPTAPTPPPTTTAPSRSPTASPTTASPTTVPPTTVPPTTVPPATVPPTTTTAPSGSPPTASPDLYFLARDTTTTVDVLANDTDPDSDLNPASLTIAIPPAQGAASVTDGKIAFTAPNTPGFAVLTYRICDTANHCATATATFVYG